MKKIGFTSLIFLLCFVTYSQYTPELKSTLKRVKEASYYDSIQLFDRGSSAINLATKLNQKGAIAEVYLYYGNYFYYIRNIDRAKSFMEKAKVTAQGYQNTHIEDLANIRLIYIDYELGINSNGEEELNLMLQKTKELNDNENYLECLNLIAIINEAKNKTKEAAKLYLDGLNFAETHHVEYYPSVFLNNLGLIKLYTGQVDEALLDFEKALISAKKENNQNLISHIKLNICLIDIRKDRVKEANLIFNEIIHYARINNRPRELASAFVNISTAFNETNPTLALAYADSSILTLKGNALNTELTKAYLNKAEILIKLKRHQEAEYVLKLAKLEINNTKNLEDEIGYSFLNYKLVASEGKHQDALTHYLQYRKLKDSSEQILNGKIIQGLQLKYNVQKKEIELEKEKSKYLLLEQKNQDERFLRWLSIGIALIVLLLISSLIYYLYSKKLQEKQTYFSQQLIQNIEADRLRISMDLHDDIGQSLSMIKTKLGILKNNHQPIQDVDNELAKVIEQTREISRNLYPSYLEKIGLTRSIARLMENVQSASQLECSFDVVEDVESLQINTKTHIYRIIQECTNNTIKHAKASALKTSITKTDNEFTLIYQDNGIGLDGKNKNSLGLLSIKERAKIINGSVSFDEKSNKSFKLTLKFRV